MSRRFHETVAFQRNAGVGEEVFDFRVNDRVMTVDGLPGRVVACNSGPFPGTEDYEVTLDNGMGGGSYNAGQLRKLTGNTAALHEAAEVTASIPVEAITSHTADIDYPELGTILYDRLPNENVKLAANKDDEATQPQSSQQDPGERMDQEEDDEESDEDENNTDTKAAEEPADEAGKGEDDAGPPDIEQEKEKNTPDVTPPSACSFCGSANFEDPQMTGRGVRMRCSQCGGTMKSWGGQWEPEFPNSSQNKASGESDWSQGGAAGVANAPGANFKTTKLQLEAGIINWVVDKIYDRMEERKNHQILGPEWAWQTGLEGAYNHQTNYADYDCPTCYRVHPQSLHPEGLTTHGSLDANAPVLSVDDSLDRIAVRTEDLESRRVSQNFSEELGVGLANFASMTGSISRNMINSESPNVREAARYAEQRADLSQGLDALPGVASLSVSGVAGLAPSGNPTRQTSIFEEGVDGQFKSASGTGLSSHTLSRLSVLEDRETWRWHFTATWQDVQAKAKRIRKEGGVKILVATNMGVAGEVKGDHNVYETQLNYVLGTKHVADWSCGCKWAGYTWGRSPAYRRFEGRLCSHALALQYEATARGMFGKDIALDTERPTWQKAHQPVQVQHERKTDRHPEGRDLRRRAVPPGNMKRTFSSLFHRGPDEHTVMGLEDGRDYALSLDAPDRSPTREAMDRLGDYAQQNPRGAGHYLDGFQRGHDEAFGLKHGSLDTDGIYESPELIDLKHAPIFASVQIMAEHGEPTENIIEMVASHAVTREAAKAMLFEAFTDADGKIRDGDEYETPDGDRFNHGKPRNVEQWSDPEFARANPRDLSDHDDDKHADDHKRMHHRTNDAREHAPHWGWGFPEGVPIETCPQCNGSGCGHCAGQGQVAINSANPAQTDDAGDIVSGISVAGVLHEAIGGAPFNPVIDTPHVPEHAGGPSWADAGHFVTGHPLVDSIVGGAAGAGLSYAVIHGKGNEHHELGRLVGRGHSRMGLEHNPAGPNHNAHGEEFPSPRPSGNGPLDRYFRHRFDQGYDEGYGKREAVLHTADYSSADPLAGVDEQTYYSPTNHSNSRNPASTGWATSQDPGDWGRSLMSNDFGLTTDSALDSEPTVAGVLLRARDTGRLLMLQRALSDEDKNGGLWEMPGGHLEDGEKPLDGAVREFEEETGHPFPQDAFVVHTWRSGPYRGHLVEVPSEQHLDFSRGRQIENPDGDIHEHVAWWDPEHAKKNPALRPELKSAPWDQFKKAADRKVDLDYGDGGSMFEHRFAEPTANECAACARPLLDHEKQDGHCEDCLTAWEAPDYSGGHAQHVDRETGEKFVHNLRHDWNPTGYELHRLHTNSTLVNDPDEVGALPYTTGDVDDVFAGQTGGSSGDSSLPQASHDALSGGSGAHTTDSLHQAFLNTPAAQKMMADIGLTKSAMKDFSYAEQQDLINEGQGARARNYGDLKIAGTHYEHLADDDDGDLWV